MAKDVASCDLDGQPQQAHHQRLHSLQGNIEVDRNLMFVQERQAATFEVHAESSIDPVTDPPLRVDCGRGAPFQEQLLNIEKHQTERNIKEIIIPSNQVIHPPKRTEDLERENLPVEIASPPQWLVVSSAQVLTRGSLAIGIVTDQKRPCRLCQSCRSCWSCHLNKLAGLQSKEDKREEALLLVAKVHRQLQAEPLFENAKDK